MEEIKRKEINKKLHEFTEDGRQHLYASIRENGRVQLDGYFQIEDIEAICEILEESA